MGVGYKEGPSRFALDELPEIMAITQSRVEAIAPSWEWFRDETAAIDGREWHLFDYCVRGRAEEFRAIVLFTSLDGGLLGVTFACDASLADRWVPVGQRIVQSVRVGR